MKSMSDMNLSVSCTQIIVAAFRKACHDQGLCCDPVFVFSVGKGCLEDCVCVSVICDHKIFLYTE